MSLIWSENGADTRYHLDNSTLAFWLISPSYIPLKTTSLSGGLEPPTFRLTVERANQLRHESVTDLMIAF